MSDNRTTAKEVAEAIAEGAVECMRLKSELDRALDRVAELEAALAESIGQVDRLLNDHGPRIERLEQEVGA